MQVTLAAIAAFNLICDVQRFGDDVVPAISARTIIYRIDPTLGRWCEGNCPAALPIAAMAPGEIVLSYRPYDGHGGPGEAIRIGGAGDYRENRTYIDGAERRSVVGHCERAPFNGFPPESLRFALPLRVQVPTRPNGLRPGGSPR